MKQLAIIGMGPRGLYALEQLLLELSYTNYRVKISVFDASDCGGSGNVWETTQPDSNWINITERALSDIKERPQIVYDNYTLQAFPSYHHWCQFNKSPNEPDTFPPRNKVGKYLFERYNSIVQTFDNSTLMSFHKYKIEDLNLKNNQLETVGHSQIWTSDTVLLTIGHQPTELSKQLKQWQSHTTLHQSISLYTTAYPIDQLNTIKNESAINIGIRGFGLAMIDVMRYLTINNYGNFKLINPATFETQYYKVKDQKLKLVPFSLDGLPLVPKPLNATIDQWYQPTASELEMFKSEIEAVAQTASNPDSIAFLIQPMAKIIARVFLELKHKSVSHNLNLSELKTVILNWLNDNNYSHPLIQDYNIGTYKLIQNYIEMALGKRPISLDYCVGQVWRLCQPSLYKAFSHAKVNNDIIERVIALDERSKRYSYGPPIESMQQVLALVDAGILTLDFVSNPEINLVSEGWQFKNSKNQSITNPVMINSVLDAPKLLKVKAPLIKNLLQNDFIQPIHSKLGIETSPDGFVNTPKNKADVPIAVLGRLAKGSVIGVDAILECFGPRIEAWAKAYVQRLSSN
ncbi:FAD/NAD(P)-binding protein [Winogradskyella vidalii]|uniref:FAD/NAD(P)-binding protein n=1 Tax=Winogradskyella vidalii TaxID=2615024 RepID=UPI0015C8DC65|nr:FAD/NAD(P)-binding protein [Winogradskyella vidalii]